MFYKTFYLNIEGDPAIQLMLLLCATAVEIAAATTTAIDTASADATAIATATAYATIANTTMAKSARFNNNYKQHNFSIK